MASSVFGTNTAAANTAAKTGKLAFWWNWDVETKLDMAQLDAGAAQAVKDTFVPMLWGTADPPSLDWMQDHEGDVMRYATCLIVTTC